MKVRGTERSSLAGSNTSYHSIVGRASHTQPVKIDRRKRSLVNPKSIDDEIGNCFLSCGRKPAIQQTAATKESIS